MEQEELDRTARFKVGDTVQLPGRDHPSITYTVLRRYWVERRGIVYDVKNRTTVHLLIQEHWLCAEPEPQKR